MDFGMEFFLHLVLETKDMHLLNRVLLCKHMNRLAIENVLATTKCDDNDLISLVFRRYASLKPMVKNKQLYAIHAAFLDGRLFIVEMMFLYFPKFTCDVVEKLCNVSRHLDNPEMSALLLVLRRSRRRSFETNQAGANPP
jgi:hypothetical protein